MKFFALMPGLLFSIVIFAGSAPSQQQPNRIWITDVTIVSPENLAYITEGNVLIENGRIVSVERGKTTKKAADAAVISGKGQFLIPGLIDSHVHLASIPGFQPESNLDPNAAALLVELGAAVPTRGLYVTEPELDHLDDVVSATKNGIMIIRSAAFGSRPWAMQARS